MQDPNDGRMYPLDNPADAKPGWKVYEVGQELTFSGWVWRVTGFTDDGEMVIKADRRVKGDGTKLSERIKRMTVDNHPANKRRR